MSVVVAAGGRDSSSVSGGQRAVLRDYLSPSTAVLENRCRCRAARQTPQPSLLLFIYLYIFRREYGIGFETRKSHSDNTWQSAGSNSDIRTKRTEQRTRNEPLEIWALNI